MSRPQIIAALFLVGIAAPASVKAQSDPPRECGEECAKIVDEIFAWISEAFEMPLSEVLVDSVKSGFELTTNRNPARIVKPNHLAVARAKHGFGVTTGGGTAVRCKGRNCTIDGGSMIVSFNAPAISGISATIRVATSREATIKPGPGIDPATVGESRISFKLYSVKLRRLGPIWIVTSAEVIAFS